MLALQRGAGNQAVARAVLARNPKYKHEAGYKRCGVDERPYYCELRDKGFPEANIKVAGPGGSGADFVATGERLWIVEVKGGRDIKWMSTANIEREGNVPAKQLGEALSSRLGHKITGATPSAPEGEASPCASTSTRRPRRPTPATRSCSYAPHWTLRTPSWP